MRARPGFPPSSRRLLCRRGLPHSLAPSLRSSPPPPRPWRRYARLSYEKNWAISMFTVIPLSYNRVDHEYAGVHWKTEEEMMAEIETKPVEPMPPGWGKQPEAHAEDDMA